MSCRSLYRSQLRLILNLNRVLSTRGTSISTQSLDSTNSELPTSLHPSPIILPISPRPPHNNNKIPIPKRSRGTYPFEHDRQNLVQPQFQYIRIFEDKISPSTWPPRLQFPLTHLTALATSRLSTRQIPHFKNTMSLFSKRFIYHFDLASLPTRSTPLILASPAPHMRCWSWSAGILQS